MEYENFLIGIFFGAVMLLIIMVIVHPEPYFIDCGCGAQSSMCMQCIKGGNLSADICSWFVNR